MPMTRVEASVEIAAPLPAVFAYASDWRMWEEWWLGVADFRPTTGVTRGNGTRYAYKTWIAGIGMELETEIHDFVENVGWRGVVTRGTPHTTRWVFEPAGTGTRFTYTLEYRVPVPVLGPLLDSLFMRRGWQRRLARSLANLKARLEAPQKGAR
jgi:uncharacterized protein YndB with AHSA1/START domain